ncbi:hypothetical protein HPB49_010272 [Dermacentor silvarum]|uniref:Uncharacterized protein n=1 Tax=Dermacentor silvarum TaxID=543639 RepID=A0ACB8C330_DERSI|nr:hypothetical protein HPB49_010272 [Dermacentor silvarum]
MVPACSCYGTIGHHRTTACPSPKAGFCSRCSSQVPTTPEGLAQHDCQPRCILCTGPHETWARGCPGKYHKPIKPSQPVSPQPASPPPRTPRQGRAPLTQPKSGSRSKAPLPATPDTSRHSQHHLRGCSPPPANPSSSPLGPPSQERPQTQAVAAAVSQDLSSALPLFEVPLDDHPPIHTTLPIQDRLTGLEQPSLTTKHALRALPDLLIQRIGETIVPKITAGVLKAVQIWACSQFRFKKSRSRSASPNATPRRRKLAGTANAPPPLQPATRSSLSCTSITGPGSGPDTGDGGRPLTRLFHYGGALLEPFAFVTIRAHPVELSRFRE